MHNPAVDFLLVVRWNGVWVIGLVGGGRKKGVSGMCRLDLAMGKIERDVACKVGHSNL